MHLVPALIGDGLSVQVLICIWNCGHACRRVPFHSMRWSRVRDQFGDRRPLHRHLVESGKPNASPQWSARNSRI